MTNDAQQIVDECGEVDMLGTGTMDLGEFDLDLNNLELNF